MHDALGRRNFIRLAGGTAAALGLGACSWSEQVAESVAASTSSTTTTSPSGTSPSGSPAASGRPLLVVVNLGGGNDALNTVVPLTGGYHDLRPTIGLADDTLLPLDGAHGLHPSLAPIAPLWTSGQLAIAQGVGITGQSRSHFAATDTLFAAQTGYSETGWLGRWLDTHPNATTDPLLAVALGGGRSAMAGTTASATVISRPDQFLLQTAPGMDAQSLTNVLINTAAPSPGSNALELVRSGVPKAMHAIDVLDQIDAPSEAAISTIAPTSASTLLSVAAQIVQLNVSTEVVMVDLGGYDTHANQLDNHANLLADLALGLSQLYDAVERSDRDVLIITTSEFGRRAADNGSGTDHGNAGNSLVIGPRVNGGQIIGALDVDGLVDGDLPIEVDTRSLYANGLAHIGGDPNEILGMDYDQLGLLL